MTANEQLSPNQPCAEPCSPSDWETKCKKRGCNQSKPQITCSDCGDELVYNVPRLGPDGGYVHKNGKLLCPPAERREAEANDFACRLLVPDMLLEKEDLQSVDLVNDKALDALCKKFVVPRYVMVRRLEEFRREKGGAS